MHVIYDNLIAVLISGFLLLILVQLNRSGNEARVDSTRYYAGRIQATAFTETLQRDFRNIGSGVDAAQTMIDAFQWDSNDKYIEFYTTVGSGAGAPVEQIRYEVENAPDCQTRVSRNATPDPIPCFRVDRSVWDGTQFVKDGGSMDTLTEFEIELRDGNGTSVAGNLDDTREITLQMVAMSPLGEERIIKRMRWQTRFHPFNLTRKDA